MKTRLSVSLLLILASLSAKSADLNTFYKCKTAKELPFDTTVLSEKIENGIKITGLKFNGGDINGKPTRIYAYYTRPAKPGTYPAVLNIHGAGLNVLHPDTNYPKHGFACLSMDWAGEAPLRKKPRKPPFSEFDSTANMADTRSGQWKIGSVETNGIRVGVIFARRALEFLRNQPEVDDNNIFTVGSSAGAHLSLLLIGLEPTIKAAVVKYGTAYIRDIPGFFGGYFGPVALCPKSQQDEWLEYYDPKHLIKQYKTRVLLLSGTDDIFFWMPLVFKTFREIPSEKRLLMRPNDNHRLVGSETISVCFFKEAMDGNLNDWPNVSQPTLTEGTGSITISAGVTSTKKLKGVTLIYKVMPLPFQLKGNKNYPWQTMAMQQSGDCWTATLPAINKEEDQLVAYVNAEDVSGGIASSDTVEFPEWPRWRGLPGADRRPKVKVGNGNLLKKDGQFEQKSGFHFTGKATVDTSGRQSRTGKGAAYVFGGDKHYIARGVPAIPGKKFCLKGWFKSADATAGKARLQLNWKGSKPFKYNIITPKIKDEYQQLVLEGTIPPGTRAGILIITSPGKGMYIDNLDYRITD